MATQTVFGSGKSGSNTGFLMKLKNYGKTIYAEGITSNRYTTLSFNIGNALEKWTHVAMVEHGGSGMCVRNDDVALFKGPFPFNKSNI